METAPYSRRAFIITLLPRFLIKIKTFAVFIGSVSRLEVGKSSSMSHSQHPKNVEREIFKVNVESFSLGIFL